MGWLITLLILGLVVYLAKDSDFFLPKDIKEECKGRTEDQKKVIKYFLGGGCLSKQISDAEYDQMVRAKATETDFRMRALDKIGLDESQVSEIEPVHFEGFNFDDSKTYAHFGVDKKWRSSAYQITWIFFSSSQIYVYQYTFNMAEDGKKEATLEYFYKDVTNFSASADTVEKQVLDKTTCKGENKYKRTNVDSNRFTIIVPGDKLYCSMEQNDYTDRAIQGMKAKLREKKES